MLWCILSTIIIKVFFRTFGILSKRLRATSYYTPVSPTKCLDSGPYVEVGLERSTRRSNRRWYRQVGTEEYPVLISLVLAEISKKGPPSTLRSLHTQSLYTNLEKR